MIRLIAALDARRGLATDKGIPWDLPTDRQYFRDQLAEGLILMGANTYRQLHEPMADRTNYVITHNTGPLHSGFEAVHDIDAFFRVHQGERINDIGGASLFEQTIPYAYELILTQIYADFDCTKFFPEYTEDFALAGYGQRHTENGLVFRFETWIREQRHD